MSLYAFKSTKIKHHETSFLHSECQHSLFQEGYKRNNKRNGQKNIRCFPHCCKQHNPHGFCGGGVSVVFSGTIADPKDIVVMARFELANEAENSIRLYSEIPANGLAVKDHSNFLAPWHKGVYQYTTATHGFVFEINGNRQSWHYGWTSNRTVNRSSYHQLVVYFFESHGDTYKCIDKLNSRPFHIVCSRVHSRKPIRMKRPIEVVEKKKSLFLEAA